MPGIVARKIGMTRIFSEGGDFMPVTILRAPTGTVVQVKTVEKDGYTAVVIGFEPLKKPRKTKKYKILREFNIDTPDQFKIGDVVTVDWMKDIKNVDITATSKGKGYAGFMKRWHFGGGPRTHGSHFAREPGSIGARSKPGRIHKGKHMAGHMGSENVTLENIPLLQIDSEDNVLIVKGPVPGPYGGIVLVRNAK